MSEPSRKKINFIFKKKAKPHRKTQKEKTNLNNETQLPTGFPLPFLSLLEKIYKFYGAPEV